MRLNRYFLATALCGALILPAGFATRAIAQDRQDNPNYQQDPNYRQDRDRDDRQDPAYRQDRDHDRDYDRDRDHRQSGYDSNSYLQMARERGYQDGLKRGEQDMHGHHSFRPMDADDYKRGDIGYRSDYGDKDTYRGVYRQAFEQGYRQGFYANSRGEHNDHDRDDRDHHDRDDHDRDRDH